jgi:hypothetical protein
MLAAEISHVRDKKEATFTDLGFWGVSVYTAFGA